MEEGRIHPDPERLSRVPILGEPSEDEPSRLAAWLDVQEFEAGKKLTREGSMEYEFLILDEGRARVDHDGRTLATLGPGDVFGELAFFADGHRMADVIAETHLRVLAMFGTRFRELEMSMPEVAERIQELARERTKAVRGG
jgi:cAMP-dependent protein kinase regulator